MMSNGGNGDPPGVFSCVNCAAPIPATATNPLRADGYYEPRGTGATLTEYGPYCSQDCSEQTQQRFPNGTTRYYGR
jgi:hypothetical protein